MRCDGSCPEKISDRIRKEHVTDHASRPSRTPKESKPAKVDSNRSAGIYSNFYSSSGMLSDRWKETRHW